MKHIIFEYRDEWCLDGKFHKQECWCESLEKCYEFYGLNNCEHRILLVEDAKRKEEEND